MLAREMGFVMSRAEVGGLQSNFGAAVRALRRRRGWSVDELSRQLEMSASELEQLEAGSDGPQVPAQELMNQLARVLEVTLTQLAEQAERCRQAEMLRQLAMVVEAGTGVGTPLQQMQGRLVRVVLFGEVEVFADLVRELRGVVLEPRS